MAVRHAYKLTHNIRSEQIQKELTLNRTVTIFHVILIASTSICAILNNFYFQTGTSYNVLRAFQDIFLSYNMFFLLNENRKADLIRDESRMISYQLLDVVKP